MPIVNIDAFILIERNFGKPDFEHVKYVRKNRRRTGCASGYVRFTLRYETGIDLNRNYDIHFDTSSKGASKNRCDIEYQGPKAFSEPETRAIQNLVLNTPNLVSALNIHAYANLWIFPYSYDTDPKSNLIKLTNHRLWTAYKEFVDLAPFGVGVRYGDAVNTIGYSATGEASDWMLHHKNIFAFSPELGADSEESKTFYPDIDGQLESLR